MKAMLPSILILVTSAVAQTWQPKPLTTWNYQIGETPANLSIKVQAYDIDGFDNTAQDVQKIHAAGSKAICYIDVGTWENWRPDASQFPASVKGNTNGWPGERWLDIRQLSVLGPIITERFQMCRDKGFDAIEADNVDGYTNKTGFSLTAQDQLTFNKFYAGIAHSFRLPIALKNDTDQIPQLVSYFDFDIDEQCFQYSECNTLQPFINADKAVLEVEYQGKPSKFCPKANTQTLSTIKKSLNLTALPFTSCQ